MKKLAALFLCVMVGVCLHAAQLPVALGSASTFSVLGASTVTNTGPTAENGDLGVSPGAAVTGFPPGQLTGGAIHAADGPAGLAQGDLTTAYNDAAGRTLPVGVAGDLGGQTLTPGLYKSTSSLGITGVLRLDGQGNANSVFIFQVASALTTASGSQIILQGGAQAANIFWQVGSSATLGTNSIFNGTILAQASISLTTGAALNGRALARTGAVTLDSNTIVNPGPPTAGGTPTAMSIACPSSNAQAGIPYNSFLTATGGTPPYSFSITGSLPSGLILSASTGAITGTPAGPGTISFTINAVDSAAGNATRSCSITTAPAVVNPLNVSCPASAAQAGVPYSSSLVASGGTPPYSFSTTGSLPAGLSINASTGAITGTPTAAGTTSFAANSLDSGSVSATRNCAITTTPAAVALNVSCPVSSAQVGVAYNSSIAATGGTAPYTFSISGALPSGLSLSASTGAINGTPTSAGSNSFVAIALDSASGSATKSCSIAAAAAPPPLNLTCPVSAAQVGVAYNSSIVATGGTAPYTFSITAGSLLAGLGLSASTGAITGTPTAAGTNTFVASAVDSASGTASKSCLISTPTQTPPIQTPAPPSLILVLTGFGCTALYRSRERVMRMVRRN